jgi:hypothetical protein
MPTDELRQVATSAQQAHHAIQDHEQRIVVAYEAGASMADISAATTIPGNGTGQYTEEGVRQLLIRRGVKLRGRGRPPKQTP